MAGFPSRSDSSAEAHHRLVLDRFRCAFNVLSGTDDLSPRNGAVNDSLGALVRAVLDCTCHDHCSVLAAPDVQIQRQPLLALLARAEFEMEKFYATPEQISRFPYHENYRALIREEIAALRSMGVRLDGPVFFVGSGPLPLSAIEFSRQTGCPVLCVEKDAQAASLSRGVIGAYGLHDSICVIEADGARVDYADSSLVMVAALAAGKDILLRRIHKTAPGARLGLRSAEGLRTLLYDAVDAAAITRQGYRLGGKSRTSREIINTTLLFAPA